GRQRRGDRGDAPACAPARPALRPEFRRPPGGGAPRPRAAPRVADRGDAVLRRGREVPAGTFLQARAGRAGRRLRMTAEAGKTGSLWAEVRDAIRGTGADYTRIPLRKAVFLLAVPMVLELVLESTFAVVDIFFVA